MESTFGIITLDTYLRIIIARTIHSPAIWVPKQLANNGVALLELLPVRSTGYSSPVAFAQLDNIVD